jgi:hypothetical protein
MPSLLAGCSRKARIMYRHRVMVDARAIAAVWPGPNELVSIIASYAIFSDKESAMITLLDHCAARRKRPGIKLAGTAITWPLRDNDRHWFLKQYTMCIDGRCTPAIAFHQLFPDSCWMASTYWGCYFNYNYLVSNWLKDPHGPKK